jgi:glycosyltransferase involved in cell wall biosynthesis
VIRRIVMLGTAAQTRGGIAAVVAAWRDAGAFERWPVDYVATHCEGGAAAKLAIAARGLRRFLALLAEHRRVLVHVHCASRASFWRKSLFMAIAHAARCPVVLHLHGGDFVRFYEEECGPLRRRVVRHFLRRAACVIGLTERWRDWLAQASGNLGVVCIPNPVRVPAAPASREPRRVVLFLGRIEDAKGIPELLRSFAALRLAVPGVQLVCAGAGDIEAARRRAEALGVAEAVRFPGWIGAAEKRAWLARAALLVLPSRAEGLPMSLLEAMAAGVPVVASAVGGIPDLVHHGVNGLLVAPRDSLELLRALRRLLREPALAARLGAAGRETVRARHAPERVLERLGTVYRALGVAPAPAPAPRAAQLRRVA